MKKILAAAAVLALALLFSPATAQDETTTKETNMSKPHVVLVTNMGEITLELDAENAPITVNNFVQYALDDYYDGTVFHRVMDGFMIQGGGFLPNLDKKEEGIRPGIKNEWKNGLKNKNYTIAMARLGRQPDSATAQFFINVADNAFLDQPNDGAGYAVFGKVVEGKEVVDKIKATETIEHAKYPGGKVVPAEAVIIEDVRLPEGYNNADLAAKVAKMEEKAKAKPTEKSASTAKLAASSVTVEEFIAAAEKEKGKKFTKTDSGLYIMMVNEGEGEMPAPTDTVEVHYRGMFLDGREFDSSYSRGKPTQFGLNRVIKGWTEGVGMMKPGGLAVLVIPPDLAYGSRGAGGAIPPNSTLAFQIELLGIK